MGKNWLKNELHLEVVDLKDCALSEDLAGFVNVYHEDKKAKKLIQE